MDPNHRDLRGAFFFPGAAELLPTHFRGNTFGQWVFLAILLAPFGGVLVLCRLRRIAEQVALGIGLAWLWLLVL